MKSNQSKFLLDETVITPTAPKRAEPRRGFDRVRTPPERRLGRCLRGGPLGQRARPSKGPEAVSVYHSAGTKFWIITEADRAATVTQATPIVHEETFPSQARFSTRLLRLSNARESRGEVIHDAQYESFREAGWSALFVRAQNDTLLSTVLICATSPATKVAGPLDPVQINVL